MQEKRSHSQYKGIDIPFDINSLTYREMWKKGWFDEYNDNHFLLRALKGDDKIYFNVKQYCDNVTMYGAIKDGFSDTFCINFLSRLNRMVHLFGEKIVKDFIINQFAAGKKHYNESMLFEALSEIEVLCYFGTFGPGDPIAEYEPQSGRGNCNPEASFSFPQGYVFNIEVKTPEFERKKYEKDIFMPLCLLNKEGRNEFERECFSCGGEFVPPRVSKLKSFLESACDKFHIPIDKEYNILCINWSYSDVRIGGYIEPSMLLYNTINGLFRNKEIAAKAGISEEIYEKISAIFVFQNSIDAIEMMDLRYLWAGNPRKAVLILNPFILDTERKRDEFYHVTQMRKNDFDIRFDFFLYYDTDSGIDNDFALKLMDIIKRNTL